MSPQASQRLVDRPWFNKLCILLVAALWGYSFVTMKGMVTQMPVFYLLAVRNAIAAAAMGLVLRGRLRALRDRRTLLVGLGKSLPNVPIGVVQIILWSAVTIVGWALGGPVGVGTLLSAFGAGAVMQLVYQLLHFEPRDIEHKSVIEVNRQLLGQ